MSNKLTGVTLTDGNGVVLSNQRGKRTLDELMMERGGVNWFGFMRWDNAQLRTPSFYTRPGYTITQYYYDGWTRELYSWSVSIAAIPLVASIIAGVAAIPAVSGLLARFPSIPYAGYAADAIVGGIIGFVGGDAVFDALHVQENDWFIVIQSNNTTVNSAPGRLSSRYLVSIKIRLGERGYEVRP